MYDEVANVALGAVIKDANSIVLSSKVFKYRGHENHTGFSNLLRELRFSFINHYNCRNNLSTKIWSLKTDPGSSIL